MKHRSTGDRVVGGILLFGAVLGVIISVLGLLAVWRAEKPLVEKVGTGLDLLSQTLQTSADGLVVLDTSLTATSDTIANLRVSAQDLSQSLGETVPLIRQTGDMVGVDMTAVVRDTQSSLTAVQSSARLMDDTIRVIAAIPLIGRRYEPERSLSESISDVSTSLEGLPESFTEIQTGMETTADNLEVMRQETDLLVSNLEQAETSIADAREIVTLYQGQVSDLTERVNSFRQGVSGWVRAVKFGVTLLLVWLLVAQLGLLTQGLERLESGKHTDRA